MLTLGLDSSTKYAGVSIVEDGKVIAHSTLLFRASHSEKLLPAVVRTLEILDIPLERIDFYAVTVGPGSFTGLRVAVSTVKGLAFATGKRVVPLSTLEVIARAFAFVPYPICPILDARKGEVYAALFRWSERGFERIMDDTVMSVEALLSLISEKTLFVGDGLEIYGGKIREIFGHKAIIAEPFRGIPLPSIVALLGEDRAKSGQTVSARELVPKYLRKSEAEIKFG